MKQYALLVLVAVVAFFAGMKFGARGGGGEAQASAAEVSRVASDASRPPLEAGAREERAPSGGNDRPRGDRSPTAARKTAARPADLEGLRQRLSELRATRSKDTREWREVLEGLVQLGTEEAIGLVLEAMEDPGCALSPQDFARLLGPVEDERIFPAAKAVLERNIEQGLDSWAETWGYLDLIAAKGGARAGDILAALLRKGGQLAHGAAERLEFLDGKVAPEPFLAALADPALAGVQRAIAESLAQWSDPRVQARLVEIAGSAEAPVELRADVLRALASEASAQELQGFGRWYWSAADDAERVLALQAIGYLGYASRAPQEEVRAAALPMLLDALQHSERDVWLAAAQCLADHEAFHVEAVRAALSALLASGESEEDLKLVRRSLSAVEQTLR